MNIYPAVVSKHPLTNCVFSLLAAIYIYNMKTAIK